MEDRRHTEAENCENCKYRHDDCYDRWAEMNDERRLKEDIINCWESE